MASRQQCSAVVHVRMHIRTLASIKMHVPSVRLAEVPQSRGAVGSNQMIYLQGLNYAASEQTPAVTLDSQPQALAPPVFLSLSQTHTKKSRLVTQLTLTQ